MNGWMVRVGDVVHYAYGLERCVIELGEESRFHCCN